MTEPSGRVSPVALDDADLDARRSDRFRRRFPHLGTLLDASGMGERLCRALRIRPGWSMEGIDPAKIHVVGADAVRLRYTVRLRHGGTGRMRRYLVSAHLFDRAGAAEGHTTGVLAPLAEAVADHPSLEPFEAGAAALADLRASLWAFPVDPDLPGLPGASDPRRMGEILAARGAWPSREDAPAPGCDISVAHYPRASRCVLRYSPSRAPDTDRGAGPGVVYGKTYSEPGMERSLEVLQGLHRLAQSGGLGVDRDGERVNVQIPEPLGHVPELNLNLMSAVVGEPRIPTMVKAGEPGTRALRQAVAEAGALLAALHGAAIDGARPRSLVEDLAQVRIASEHIRDIAPELGELIAAIVDELSGPSVARSRTRLAHGDFTPSQILFDGRTVGLIDFDNVCVADPALDLGHFTAYLRTSLHKAAHRTGASAEPESDRLAATLLEAYVEAASPPDPVELRERVARAEQVSLVRMAVHGWQQLKPSRVALALAVLRTER